jgi:hypothetical protein
MERREEWKDGKNGRKEWQVLKVGRNGRKRGREGTARRE